MLLRLQLVHLAQKLLEQPATAPDFFFTEDTPTSCGAVGKRTIEKLGGSYECTPYRAPADAM